MGRSVGGIRQQGATLRQSRTVSERLPVDSARTRLAVSPQLASFSTCSQSPSVYLDWRAAPARPVSVTVQCAASPRVSGTPAGLQAGWPAPTEPPSPARQAPPAG